MTSNELQQLGAQAHGHYRAAEKAAEKAEQHYKSAGIILLDAKEKVLKTRGLTWPRFLAENCPIGRSRADEIIMIANGEKTYEQTVERHREKRARQKSAERPANRPEKPRENKGSEIDSLIAEVIDILKKAPIEDVRLYKAMLDMEEWAKM